LPREEVAGKHATLWEFAIGTRSRHIEAEGLHELAGTQRQARRDVELDERVVDDLFGRTLECRMELQFNGDTNPIGDLPASSGFEARQFEVLRGVLRWRIVDPAARKARLDENLRLRLQRGLSLAFV
jgi:hypothetical protein